MKLTSHFFSIALLSVALAFTPGCSVFDWLKNKSCTDCNGGTDDSTAVITLDNKQLLSCKQFGDKLDLIYQARQGIQELITQMPEEKQLEVLKQIAEGFVAEQLIVEDAKKRKLVNEALAKQAHTQLDTDLAVRAFQDDLTCTIQDMINKIDDNDARKFYEENREKMPIFQNTPFLLNAAQVKASKVPAEYAKFEAVKDVVKQVMMQDKMPAIYNEKLESMKKGHAIAIDEACLRTFVTKKEVPSAEQPSANQSAPAESTGKTPEESKMKVA